ncbi:MAG: hypothetical protein LBH46_00315, partial [Rickettsiales bacterium]|nr:hypothetical protein [Rickettsiales bacterium]
AKRTHFKEYSYSEKGEQTFNPSDYGLKAGDTIRLEVWGAQGGGTNGGKGGYSKGNYTLPDDKQLHIYVGGQGGTSNGGWNGGGKGGDICGTNNGSLTGYKGSGGGGASDIRTVAGDLDSRLIVAGGGGGASAYNDSKGGNPGGSGGGSDGSNGGNNCTNNTPTNGAPYSGCGGTQEVGGSKGYVASGFTAGDGIFGEGGSGGYAEKDDVIGDRAGNIWCGGGGGGGYYGGGGGDWAGKSGDRGAPKAGGGGGGSGYISDKLFNISAKSGDNSGNGKITISW